jgi:hypothetical protein
MQAQFSQSVTPTRDFKRRQARHLSATDRLTLEVRFVISDQRLESAF